NHAFSVVSTSEQTYKGVGFLLIHATVPADFQSASENWCRDYQNLCAEYDKRPTGTGLDGTLGWDMSWNTRAGSCVTGYGSDPYINNVLGDESQSPTEDIKAMVVRALGVQDSYAYGRCFGFLYCDPGECHRDLAGISFSLHSTYAAVNDPGHDRTVFTVCTGKLGNDACKTANGGCADVCIHTQIGTRCLCTQPGFRLMADGRGCEGERPYKCDRCGYAAAQKGTLDNHIAARHTGDKPFMCGECGYRTARKSSLSGHLRTHTGEKPYKCDQCGYSAANKSTLKNHLVIYTGVKPYIYGECGYRAAQQLVCPTI
ncbi:zinc finger protein 84-like, partial [Branchiostoma floridae]|uniref:Zinc finger protein 84-like n=1 Tax=Branchiostoma floridae TaxID=7739 RepID=A0A9J7KL67_BRAFL